MAPAENPKPKTARVISRETGTLIGGLIHREHGDDEVTILHGSLPVRGRTVSHEEVLELEANEEARDGRA